MLSYDKWKLLNESLGSTVLGLGQRHSLGLVSNIPTLQEKSCEMGECGESEEDGEDESEGEFEVDMEDYDDDDADVKKVEEEDDEVEDDEDDEDDEEEDEYEEEDDEEDDDSDEDEVKFVADSEESMSSDPETEEEDEMDDSDEGMHALMQLKNLKPEANQPTGKDLKEVEWWKSVSSMIGTMTPSGNIVFEANKNKLVKEEEEVEVEVEKKDAPKIGNVAQTALSRFERYLTGNKLKNISAKNIQTLVRALLSHILDNNDKSQAALIRKTFMDALKSYVSGK